MTLRSKAAIEAAGFRLRSDEPLAGYDRIYVDAPFGNRIELLEPLSRSPPDEPAYRPRRANLAICQFATREGACRTQYDESPANPGSLGKYGIGVYRGWVSAGRSPRYRLPVAIASSAIRLDPGLLAVVDSDLNLFKQRVDPPALRRAPLLL